MKMTLKAAKAELKQIGFTLTKLDGEYRVKSATDKTPGAGYFTDDLADAVSTAKARVQPHNPANGTKLFKVLARSSNANSFGLRKHIIVSKDGEAFSFCRSVGPWNTDFTAGTEIVFGLDSEGRVMSRTIQCELWERLPAAPASVTATLFA